MGPAVAHRRHYVRAHNVLNGQLQDHNLVRSGHAARERESFWIWVRAQVYKLISTEVASASLAWKLAHEGSFRGENTTLAFMH